MLVAMLLLRAAPVSGCAAAGRRADGRSRRRGDAQAGRRADASQEQPRPAGATAGAGLNQFADHFYIDGTMTLGLRVGQYTFELEAGPEYRTQEGHFEIERHADDTKRIEMHPFADLAKEGWYAGDLDVERRAERFAAGDEVGVARLRAESRRRRAERARRRGCWCLV